MYTRRQRPPADEASREVCCSPTVQQHQLQCRGCQCCSLRSHSMSARHKSLRRREAGVVVEVKTCLTRLGQPSAASPLFAAPLYAFRVSSIQEAAQRKNEETCICAAEVTGRPSVPSPLAHSVAAHAYEDSNGIVRGRSQWTGNLLQRRRHAPMRCCGAARSESTRQKVQLKRVRRHLPP